MIQIIGLLLCVYLCYKGLEILQLSLTSSTSDKTHQIVGVLAFISSVLVALVFAYWLIQSGDSQELFGISTKIAV